MGTWRDMGRGDLGGELAEQEDIGRGDEGEKWVA